MKLGWCLPLRDAALAAQVGLDYIELRLFPFGVESPSALARARRCVRECTLPPSVFRSVLPPDIVVVGASVDEDRLRRYFGNSAELLDAAGAKVVVFGDSRARSIPVGFDRSRAGEQFLKCLELLAEALKGSGVVVGLEPISAPRCNHINTLAEAARVIQLINRPGVGLVADIYHMMEERDPFSALGLHAESLVHVHLADSGRRRPGSGNYDYASFFGYLRRGGYAGLLSVECSVEELGAELRSTHAFVRSAWESAR